MTEKDKALLPCPFCGGAPIMNHIEPHTHHLMFNGEPIMPYHQGSWTIECCDVGMIKDTREEAIAAWNRRSQPEWLPIESAPKDGKPILVCNDTTMAAVYWWPCVWMGTTHNGMQKPTHWMPLPAAPQPPIAGNDGREG